MHRNAVSIDTRQFTAWKLLLFLKSFHLCPHYPVILQSSPAQASARNLWERPSCSLLKKLMRVHHHHELFRASVCDHRIWTLHTLMQEKALSFIWQTMFTHKDSDRVMKFLQMTTTLYKYGKQLFTNYKDISPKNQKKAITTYFFINRTKLLWIFSAQQSAHKAHFYSQSILTTLSKYWRNASVTSQKTTLAHNCRPYQN